jgi:hypothetical protein
MMNANFDKAMEGAAAFQRLWMDTMTKAMQGPFMMNTNLEKSVEETAAFQRTWMETMSKAMQGPFMMNPNLQKSMEEAAAFQRTWMDIMSKVMQGSGMMNPNAEKSMEEAASFQRIWMDTLTKVMQAAFTISPNSAPPELLRQIRNGIFQALAGSWEEFMRSPQFLEGTRQWMENAITFRKMTNDFMGKVRNEMQAPSRGDIDSIMLTVRHIEKRLLDRMDELSTQIEELKAQAASQPSPARRRSPRAPRNVTPGNGMPKTP